MNDIRQGSRRDGGGVVPGRSAGIRAVTDRAAAERGASMVEYALLVALIAVVCLGALSFVGGAASDNLSTVGASLN